MFREVCTQDIGKIWDNVYTIEHTDSGLIFAQHSVNFSIVFLDPNPHLEHLENVNIYVFLMLFDVSHFFF